MAAVGQLTMFDMPAEPVFSIEEKAALAEEAIPEPDWPLLRQVLKKATVGQVHLWKRTREKVPLETIQGAVDNGLGTLDEINMLSAFPDGVPQGLGDDPWAAIVAMRNCARVDVGWFGHGDHTLGSSRTEYAVMDFETLGLNPYLDRVIEVGITRMTGQGVVLDRWSSFVNPQGAPVRFTEIHGITEGDLLGAPTWPDIHREVLDRMNDAVVVAHNIAFEEHMLACESYRMGAAIGNLPGLDTRRLAPKILDDLPDRKLSTICERLGVVNGNAHRALGDSDATAAVLRDFIAQGHRKGMHTFGFRTPLPVLSPESSVA